MSVVYGIDPGLKNCAIVKLSLWKGGFAVSDMDLIDVSRSMRPFYNYVKSKMLEEGDVYIEFQFRGGKVRDTSHHMMGYLTAMMGKKRVLLKQSRDKFALPIKLGIMPENPGELKIYKNRKSCSEAIMAHILAKTEDGFFSKMQRAKRDDLADALLYALWAARDRMPSSLAMLNATESEKLKPLEDENRIHVTI